MASAGNNARTQELREEHLLAVEQKDEMEIDLVALMYRLLEKVKWLIAAALVGAIAAGVFTHYFITPTYKATAKLYVLESGNTAINLNDLNIGEKLAADYVQVFNNWHVHEMVIKSLNLPYSYSQIQKMLSISIPSSTRIIQITVSSHSAQEARDIAMAYAQFAPSFIEAKMQTSRPTIFEEARVPTVPSDPSLMRNVILGFMLGGVLAAAIVVLQFIMDDRICSAEMLQKQLNLPTLGMMPIQEDDLKIKKSKKGGARG